MAIYLTDLQFLQSKPNKYMKTRLLLLLFILLRISSLPGYCQVNFDCYDLNEINREQALSGELFTPAATPDIVTYFNKSWLIGDIWLTDGTVVRNKKIRYNGLLDELLWQEPESNQTIKLDKEAIQKFHFLDFQGDTSVYFRKLKVKQIILNDSIEIFGQEIYHGDLSLFIFHSFYLLRKDKVQIGDNYFLKDIYKEEPVYYLEYLDGEVFGFKRFNRKSLYAFLPGLKDQINQYFRENKSWVIKSKPEIIKLVQFLSSVIEQ